MKNLFNLAIILCVGIFFVLGCGNANTNTSTSETKATNQSATNANVVSANTNAASSAKPNATTEPSAAGGVTKTNYDKIKTGMKYDEVVKIFGKEGESMSETEVAGYKTILYKWDGDSFMSAATLTFQNGKLVSKAQSGLK